MCTNPNLYIISGGPGSGKTTVLKELTRRGYSHASEVAREIIQEQMRNHGTALPWLDREAYTRMMLHHSIESFLAHRSAPQPMFSDRGIPDTLGYARLIGSEDDGYIQDACRQYRYALRVFVAPPWEEIYETDRERKQDYAEAERTYGQIVDVYSECGYELIALPKIPPSDRADFILERLLSGQDG